MVHDKSENINLANFTKPVLLFLRPNLITVIVFFALLFCMPVFYLTAEPLTTLADNSEYIYKHKWYPSLFRELYYGYSSTPDLFLSVFIRNYLVHNLVGVPLMLAYYLVAAVASSGVSVVVKRSGQFVKQRFSGKGH